MAKLSERGQLAAAAVGILTEALQLCAKRLAKRGILICSPLILRRGLATAESDMTEKCEFKSHKELGLTKKEWEALIKTLMAMEAGQVEHVPAHLFHNNREETKPAFNMQVWHDRYTCGTVACIAGTAEILGNLGTGTLRNTANELEAQGETALVELFCPNSNINYDAIGPKRAAKVLRGYLTNGVTSWRK